MVSSIILAEEVQENNLIREVAQIDCSPKEESSVLGRMLLP
jgi:hypothetical protein